MSVATPNRGERSATPWNFALVKKAKVHRFVMSPECAFVAVNFLTDMGREWVMSRSSDGLRQGRDMAAPSQLSSLSSRGSPSSLPTSESQDWTLPLVLRSSTTSLSTAPSTGSDALSCDLLMGKTRPYGDSL